MDWKNININKQNIEVETAKAVLIKMPNNSQYAGYKFWHPTKLVRSGRNKNALSVSFTEEFNFKLIKHGKGQYNKFDVIDQKEISAEEMMEAFGVMDQNITAKKAKGEYETYKPKQMQAIEVEADESLLDK